MHLRGYPKYFLKGGKRRAVYYTAEAAELLTLGWTPEEEAVKEKAEPKTESAPATEVKPEPEKVEVEVVEDEPGDEQEPATASELPNFDFMTKAELLQYALDRGADLSSNTLKAELVEACRKLG